MHAKGSYLQPSAIVVADIDAFDLWQFPQRSLEKWNHAVDLGPFVGVGYAGTGRQHANHGRDLRHFRLKAPERLRAGRIHIRGSRLARGEVKSPELNCDQNGAWKAVIKVITATIILVRKVSIARLASKLQLPYATELAGRATPEHGHDAAGPAKSGAPRECLLPVGNECIPLFELLCVTLRAHPNGWYLGCAPTFRSVSPRNADETP